MNYSNILTIISTLVIVIIFLCGVFFNLEIKKSKEELEDIKTDIEQLKLDIKRQEIEISVLTSPLNVVDYIEKKELKPIKLTETRVIVIKK